MEIEILNSERLTHIETLLRVVANVVRVLEACRCADLHAGRRVFLLLGAEDGALHLGEEAAENWCVEM